MAKLTLDEIAQLVEKVTDWIEGGHYMYERRDKRNNYVGDFRDKETTVEISCGLSGIFPWEKRAGITIWAAKTKESQQKIVHEEGRNIYPIYQRVKILAKESIMEHEQERRRDKTKEINQACDEVRTKYLKN